MLSVLLHGRSNSGVSLGGSFLNERGSVRRSTDINQVTLFVTEFNLDLDRACTSSCEDDRVLTIILVDDFAREFFLHLIVGLDAYLEIITSRCTVFAVIVTCLDEEFNRLVYSHFLHETTSKTERVDSSSVQEEAEVTPRGSKVLVTHSELNDTFLRSMDGVVGRFTVNLSVADVGSID
jgi:hypothetical protein